MFFIIEVHFYKFEFSVLKIIKTNKVAVSAGVTEHYILSQFSNTQTRAYFPGLPVFIIRRNCD